jgi:hypothetical protein
MNVRSIRVGAFLCGMITAVISLKLVFDLVACRVPRQPAMSTFPIHPRKMRSTVAATLGLRQR